MKYRFLISLILAVVLTLSIAAAGRDVSFENGLASDLKSLGLFSGVSENNFDLERAPSRVEAIVMLIRLLGEEEAAKNGSYEIPFEDVPDWAVPYVGYAYEKGYSKGISSVEFGVGEAGASTYLTFVLRALGYSDAEGDFSWSSPYEFAKELGVLPQYADTARFMRADAVSVSYCALSATLKNSTQTLAEKLMQKNVFTLSEYNANYVATKITERENEGKKKLSAEELFEKCSNSVFYVEVQSDSGIPISSGSGFFIDSYGMAVTNWHVINGADRVTITLQNGETYEVKTVWDYNPELDYAIISVDARGCTPLEFNPLPLKTGTEVYAIGSPKGLQNTMSYGIVSNPSRVVEGGRYIQTSAAISGGSSGGVLLNAYGEVVGITSGTYTDAQNINFARPISVIAGRKIRIGYSPATTNWEYMRCEFEKTEYNLLPGELVAVDFSARWYTPDNEFPDYTVETSDASVAIGKVGIKDGTFYILATGEGTATISIGSVYGKSPEITVVVGEGDDVGEYVAMMANVEELYLAKGTEKVIKTDSFTVNSDEKYATLSARSANSKIARVEYAAGAYDPNIKTYIGGVLVKEKYPRPELRIIGVSNGTTEIIVTNDITKETLVIPVTVGDCYDVSYKKLSQIVFDKGNYSPSDNGAQTYYSLPCAVSSLDKVAYLLYYPSKKELHLQIISYMADTIYFDIILGEEPFDVIDKKNIKDNKLTKGAKYNLMIPSKGIEISGEIPFEGFGDGKNDSLLYSSFTGQNATVSSIVKALPEAFVKMFYVFDEIFEEYFPGVSVSDFGFVDLDYKAYGLEQ